VFTVGVGALGEKSALKPLLELRHVISPEKAYLPTMLCSMASLRSASIAALRSVVSSLMA
jgi:hypothetical protein